MGKLLGPFRNARSTEPEHQSAISEILKANMLFIAEDDGEIVGVLRDRQERLHSLFVRADRHHQGIGRRLMEKFEQECLALGVKKITLASTLYAVPFYQRVGYKKTTGMRNARSFEGTGLKYQPMKKNLADQAREAETDTAIPRSD